MKEKKTQVQSTENIFNKTIEENAANLKQEVLIKVQEAYRTPSILDQKRTSEVT